MKTLAGSAGIFTCALFLSLVSCGGSADAPPSQLRRFPADLSNAKLDFSGIFQDAWTEESGAVTLQQPSGEQALTIRAMVPNLGDTSFQTTVGLSIDNVSIGSKTVGVGDFELSLAAASAAGKHRIVVTFTKVQQLPAGDGRTVGARLAFLGFERPSRTTSAQDIVQGVELGSGWGVLETYRGETFRWVDNDAHIRLTRPQTEDVALSLFIEPGPGVGGRRFLLKILDAAGRQVAATPVERRSTVKVFVPVEGGKPTEFRLHLDGGGKPAKGDPRVLNFRVFRMEALPTQGTPASR